MNLHENISRIKEVMNLSDEKDDTAKWITCRNCRHKFTQTIHKGKKSLPICPRCGTHNTKKEEKEGVGAYAAPAFEMEPDHVHFKNKDTKLSESKISDFIKTIKDRFTSDYVLNARAEKEQREAFQKVVNLVYNITIKEAPIDGVGGLYVTSVWKTKWFSNYMDDKDLGKRWDFHVRLYPLFTKDDVDENKFKQEYSVFQEKFKSHADDMGISVSSPITHKNVPYYKVAFEFLDISFDFPLPKVGQKTYN